MKSDSNIQNPNCLIAPNLATVWLFYLHVEQAGKHTYPSKYSTDNRAAQFGRGTLHDPQTEFPNYLNHTSGQSIKNRTSTPPSSRNPNLLRMPPSTNQSTFHQWTIGPVYYSTLMILAETLGTSNQSQILDLALFNNITDPSGASDYTASIAIGGGQTGISNVTPGQVKYLLAPSVSEKSNINVHGLSLHNIQTFGDRFVSNGRQIGTESIRTITCSTSANTCSFKVPAPGFALVFLTDDALSDSGGDGDQTTMTFPPTAYTKLHNAATSNGDQGGRLGSTSKGSANGGVRMGE
ncbi:glycoside hydrolase family 79 protein [Collybiopsis luxurians FD-317 M1]|uniref:Unplaced genomic scaffold GYMLUscaffold_33, whole genome shotgun sequence n=1 Tax=Collybiopsis luxurians FD-317 M1 TaxID=944289 RepID=A0A0D0CKT1_9AGAR|nr:glycoside hydrolase family 79 protein [Collybiopsis luxurians FD-317 M1]